MPNVVACLSNGHCQKQNRRAARSTDSVGMQTDSPKKSVVLAWKTHKGGGRTMSFGDQELIRFFKQKTMQQTRSRWRGHAH